MSPNHPRPTRVLPPGLVRAGVVALAVAFALAAGPPAVAQAAPRTARVCAPHVLLVETPGGAVTGIVHHYDLLRVIQGATRAKWWRVTTSFGTRGWLRQTTLCGRGA